MPSHLGYNDAWQEHPCCLEAGYRQVVGSFPSGCPSWSGPSGLRSATLGGSHLSAAGLSELPDVPGMQLASIATSCGSCQVPGAALLFIPETHCCMYAIVMFTVFCYGRWLWLSLKSTSNWALVLCDACFSNMPFHYSLVSPLGGSVLVLLPSHWYYTVDGSEMSTYIYIYIWTYYIYLQVPAITMGKWIFSDQSIIRWRVLNFSAGCFFFHCLGNIWFPVFWLLLDFSG